jgi:hypothetical protein
MSAGRTRALVEHLLVSATAPNPDLVFARAHEPGNAPKGLRLGSKCAGAWIGPRLRASRVSATAAATPS